MVVNVPSNPDSKLLASMAADTCAICVIPYMIQKRNVAAVVIVKIFLVVIFFKINSLVSMIIL